MWVMGAFMTFNVGAFC